LENGNAAQRRKKKRANQRPEAPIGEAITEQDDEENKQENLADEQKKRPKKLLERIKKWFPNAAVWTALFTGVLTLFTVFQYRVSRITSEIQRNSQRAFLSFSGPAVGARFVSPPMPNNSAPWNGQEIAINWSNNGETPARNVVIHLGANGFFPDIPAQFDYPPISDSINAVIGPKSFYGTNMQVSKDEIIDVAHGKKRLFAWGTATYDDVFEKSPKRLSEFCVELTHLTFAPASTLPQPKTNQISPQNPATMDLEDPNISLVGFQWQQCRAHNCYDEDCPDYKVATKPNP
jgi:hypothetical protein